MKYHYSGWTIVDEGESGGRPEKSESFCESIYRRKLGFFSCFFLAESDTGDGGLRKEVPSSGQQ